MARTLLTGNILRSGSIPTTALGGGVVTSSAQIIASLPGGALSSSTQVDYPSISNIPAGIVSSSGQVSYLGLSNIPGGIASSSAQVTDYLPTNTVSSSGQVTAFLPTGTVSSSTQVDVFTTVGGSTLATTGSNTFVGIQAISDTTNSTSYLDGALHIAGGMSVRKDVRISGSMTINGLLTAVSMSTQYVTSSQYNIGVSRITLNDDDNVRFAGLSIIDSGSASPTSASIFWDSLQHRFIYENLSGSSYNSAIIIAGPKNTGSIGDEIGLTSGYVPYATGDDHISDSVIYQSGGNIGIGTTNPFSKLAVEQQGGNLITARWNSSNARAGIYIGGSSGVPFIGSNLTYSSGNIFNYDTTGTAWLLGDPAGTGLLGLTVGSGTSGNAFGTETGTYKVYFNTSGQVGIGIAPSTKLDINVNGNTAAIQLRDDSSAGDFGVFSITPGTYDGGTNVIGALNTTNLQISTNAVPRLFISASSGYIGINTTAPQSLLSLYNDGTGPTVQLGANANTGVVIGGLDWINSYGANNFNVARIDAYAETQVNSATLRFYTAESATTPTERWRITTVGVLQSSGSQTIRTSTGNLTLATAAGNGHIILSPHGTGNVGIGTTNPNISAGLAGSTYLTVSTSTTGRNSVLELNGARTDNGGYTGYVRFFNNVAATPLADIQAIRAGADTTGSLAFATTNVERMRIDSSGNLLVGCTSLRSTGYHTSNGQYAMETTGYGGAQWFTNRTDSEGSYIVLGKSRGTTVNSNTIVANGDTLGGIVFQGTDGSAARQSSGIFGLVDGTPGGSDMPGRLIFTTAADGTYSLVERMRITSLGAVTGTHSTTKGPYIRSGETKNFAVDATMTLMNSTAGSALITVYDTGTGNGGVFFASYSGTVTKIAGEGEATDTGSTFAVYKSANSHTVTLKNRYGITRDFAIGIFSSLANE